MKLDDIPVVNQLLKELGSMQQLENDFFSV
jgi:hypothetical protein